MGRWADRIGALLALAATPLCAQAADPEPDPQVAERLAAASARLSIESVQDRCRTARKADEIVVCIDRGDDLRVPSTAESDPESRAARRALDGNIPSAPDVAAIKCRKGADGVCRGNIGRAPPPIYVIDPAAIPEAPAGSDADKIAKGEMPDR